MKKTSFLLITLFSLLLACKKEADNTKALLPGHWNCYEQGTEKTGFTPGFTTSLTLVYESGIAFFPDGTFTPRKVNLQDSIWMPEGAAIGIYEIKENRNIVLRFFPGTKDEMKLELQLVKLDEKHLWFKHSYFMELEYHLERAK